MAFSSIGIITLTIAASIAIPQGFGGGGGGSFGSNNPAVQPPPPPAPPAAKDPDASKSGQGREGGPLQAPAADEPDNAPMKPGAGAGAGAPSASSSGAKESDTPVEPPVPAEKGWLEKLRAPDRAALDACVGWELAAPPAAVSWTGANPPAQWKGKVVVIQSFTTKGASWKSSVLKTQRALEPVKDDVILVALLTPDGADRFTPQMADAIAPITVGVDAKGEWCDKLGVYKIPVNLLIGKDGNIRYAGLTAEGLSKAAKALIDEPLSPTAGPVIRRAAAAGTDAAGAFPPCPAPDGMTDFIGKMAPTFAVDRWLSPQPSMDGKVIVVDFWATWCPPCRASIPHMNELQAQYPGDVVCIGITDETNSAVDEGMRKHRLKDSDFKYSIASDPQRRLSQAVAVRGIPAVVVVSSDGIVRWQGHPTGLSADTLGKIVAASKAAGGGATTTKSGPPARWGTSKS